MRKGESKVGKYGNGIGRAFVVWHCKGAFQEGNECVDGVCSECMMEHGKSNHCCGNCGQNISDYKNEENAGMMMRERPPTWKEPAPEKCAICHIVM